MLSLKIYLILEIKKLIRQVKPPVGGFFVDKTEEKMTYKNKLCPSKATLTSSLFTITYYLKNPYKNMFSE